MYITQSGDNEIIPQLCTYIRQSHNYDSAYRVGLCRPRGYALSQSQHRTSTAEHCLFAPVVRPRLSRVERRRQHDNSAELLLRSSAKLMRFKAGPWNCPVELLVCHFRSGTKRSKSGARPFPKVDERDSTPILTCMHTCVGPVCTRVSVFTFNDPCV